MAKVLSLSSARKSRARIEKAQKADENAVKFGRTKAEKTRDQAEAAKQTTQLDHHKRDRDDG